MGKISVKVIHQGTGFGNPAGHQALACLMHRRLLLRTAGVRIGSVYAFKLDDLSRALSEDHSDVALIMVDWHLPLSDLVTLFRTAKEAVPGRKLVYLDYYAPTGTPNWDLLEWVDVYAKRQLLRDRTLYQADYAGGLIFTDYLTKNCGYQLDGWYFGSKPKPELMGKAVVSWNLGVTPKYRALLRLSRFNPIPWTLRRFDVNTRISNPGSSRKQEWYEVYRQQAYTEVSGMAPQFRLTGNGRVSFKRYIAEMFQSKIVFSPFGWGEVCFRDYEAVCCGCLLVKPSMDHLETSPDIYDAGVTYVSVKWDFSDLKEKITYYLDNPAEAVEIIREGQRRLRTYYNRGHFVGDFLRTIGQPASSPGLQEP